MLRDYAARLNAEPGRWNFLTGDKGTVYRLAGMVSNLRQWMILKARVQFTSTRIVLVDRRGSIRGYYDALDADATSRGSAQTRIISFKINPPPDS
mgnify:CR=1 FL=1